MGRSKSPKPPSFKSSEIKYGNSTIGKSFVDPKTGSIVNQYLPDPAEEQRKTLAQEKINQIISSLGTTSPEMASQFNQIENAFVSDAKQKFLDEYNPALRSLREDVASRFGTLNSSQFANNLTDLEKVKSSALADIINRGKLLSQDLVNQNETRKLQNIQSLGSTLNADQANLLNSLQAPMDASSSLNSFLNSQWMTQLNNYTQDNMAKRALLASLASRIKPSLGLGFGSAL